MSAIKRVLSRLIDRMFGAAAAQDDVAHTLDHVPVATAAEDPHTGKLARARRRHGKQFRTHERVARQTEPSAQLQAIQAAARAARRQPGEERAQPNVARLAARRKP